MKKKCKSDNNSPFRITRFILMKVCLLTIFTSIIFSSCNNNTSIKNYVMKDTVAADIYYCPMHPEIQQSHPGICPKPECKGMALVKKIPVGILNAVLKPTNSSVLSTIKTIHPEEKEIPISFEAQGYIDYNNNTKHTIASRLNGRIEKLYVKYNYQPVSKGEKIFELYSPELITAEENLIYLIKTDKDASDLIRSAKEKLEILGLTKKQIENLIDTKTIKTVVTFYSDWDGHLRETSNLPVKTSVNSGSTAMGAQNAGMPASGAKSSSSSNNAELSIKEGMYVSAGQTLFNIINQKEITVILQIKAEDISKVQLGQQAEIIMDESPMVTINGKISFIGTFLKPDTKTLEARVDIDNSERNNKVGTLLKARIKSESSDGLWVPTTSVIDLGKDKMVWLKKDGYFMARKIEIGATTKDWIEIYDGIDKKDEIAEEAHYLSDSESFLKIPGNEK